MLLCSSLVSEWRSFSSLIHTTCWGPCYFMNHGWDHMISHWQIFRSLWLLVNSWPAFKIIPARPSIHFPVISLSSSVLHLPLQPTSTGSPQHTNLQVVDCQRCKCASGSSKEPEPMPPTSGVSETAVCPPSSDICWRPFSSAVSHLLSLLPSELLACSLDTSPCMPTVAPYCCTFQGTVL